MRVLRKYVFVAVLSARNNLVYFSEVLSRVVFLGVILFIFSKLWLAVYASAGSNHLADLSMAQMIWYLVVTEAITLSAPRVAATVDADVRSGNVVNYLQRPVSYPLYSLSYNFGERSVRLLMNLLVGSGIAILLVGPLNLNHYSILFFAMTVPLAFAIDFLSGFLIGLGAFWFEDTSGVNLIWSRLTMIFGGMLFPLSLFPEQLRLVLEWLPFAAVVYGPAKMLVAPTGAEFASVVLKQGLAFIVLAALVHLVYRQASKRVFVNGG